MDYICDWLVLFELFCADGEPVRDFSFLANALPLSYTPDLGFMYFIISVYGMCFMCVVYASECVHVSMCMPVEARFGHTFLLLLSYLTFGTGLLPNKTFCLLVGWLDSQLLGSVPLPSLMLGLQAWAAMRSFSFMWMWGFKLRTSCLQKQVLPAMELCSQPPHPAPYFIYFHCYVFRKDLKQPYWPIESFVLIIFIQFSSYPAFPNHWEDHQYIDGISHLVLPN